MRLSWPEGKESAFGLFQLQKGRSPSSKLFGERSLLQATGDRLLGIFPKEAIYVVVPPHLQSLVVEHLPWLPSSHIILEPEPKDTAFAVSYAFRHLPEGVIAFFPADHYVGNEFAFRQDVCLAVEAASELEGILTLGVSPTYPATSYGYLERGEEVRERVFKVVRFLEKPDRESAERLYASGRFY